MVSESRLYHYTSLQQAHAIRRAGVIQPHAIVLYRDFFMRGERRTSPPLVWLTVDERMECTIATKMMLSGCADPVMQMCRIVVPSEYGWLGLHELAANNSIEFDWFNCMVMTGGIAGSDWRDWRLSEVAIPAADWLAVEILTQLDEDGTAHWGSHGTDQ